MLNQNQSIPQASLNGYQSLSIKKGFPIDFSKSGILISFLIPILLFPFCEAAEPVVLDLADIVGGGDGTGTGGDQGLNYAGQPQLSHVDNLNPTANAFSVSSNPFVDGVFAPDGGPGGSSAIQVSSTGITVTGVSDFVPTTALTWDYIWNGHNFGVSSSLTPASLIGMHPNKGITFDLNAIEAAHPGLEAILFTTGAAMGNQDFGNCHLYIFVDGEAGPSVNLTTANTSIPFEVNLEPEDRFLTLIASTIGDIIFDWAFFADPLLTLDEVPVAPPVVPILMIFPADDAVELRWDTVDGETYQVQTSDDLIIWQDFEGILLGNEAPLSRLIQMNDDDHKFFRVVVRIPN